MTSESSSFFLYRTAAPYAPETLKRMDDNEINNQQSNNRSALVKQQTSVKSYQFILLLPCNHLVIKDSPFPPQFKFAHFKTSLLPCKQDHSFLMNEESTLTFSYSPDLFKVVNVLLLNTRPASHLFLLEVKLARM